MKKFKRALAMMLAFVMVVSLVSVTPSTTVNAAPSKYVKSLKLSKSKVTMKAGSKAKVKATIKVKGSASKKVKVILSKANKKVVKSAKVGKANKKGVSTITLTAANVTSKKTTTIKVVTYAKNSKNKKITKKIKVTVTPKAATTQATTTEAPTTQATTEAPTTQAPTTEAPTAKDVAVTAVTATTTAEKNDAGLYQLTVGSKATISATVEPADATDKTVQYSSNDEKVITVSASGEVTAVAVGNAVVTVSAGGKSTTLEFNVVPTEYSVKLDKVDTTILSLKDGYNTEKLTATVIPAGTTVDWSVSSEGIVELDQDSTNTVTVTAKKAGTVTVTAKVGDATTVTKKYVVTEDDYVIMTKASGIAEGSYVFTVDVEYAFSEDSVTQKALEDSTLVLVNTEDSSKTAVATYTSLSNGVATYTISPSDFIISGKFGEMNGTYKLTYGTGTYSIDKELTVQYTEKKYSDKIAGRVVEATTPAIGIEGVTVTTSTGFTTTTDAAGYYEVSSTNGNSVAVTFVKEGYFEGAKTTTVGNQKTSVVNMELEAYNPEKLYVEGTIKATDAEGNAAREDGFLVELQKKDAEGVWQTVDSMVTVDNSSELNDTLTYRFANTTDDVADAANTIRLPRELSLSATDAYQIVVSNGIGAYSVDPVYPTQTKSVVTSSTAHKFTVAIIEAQQVKPLAKFAIAAETFAFDEDSAESVVVEGENKTLTFESIALYATNGSDVADVCLAKASKISVPMKTKKSALYTNTDEIDLLKVFGKSFELPKTTSTNRYFLVLEHASNAYSVVEVVVSVAGAEAVINEMDAFKVGCTSIAAAGCSVVADYDATTKAANAVNGKDVYPIDATYTIIEDASKLSVNFDAYQVVDGVMVYLARSIADPLAINDANQISADTGFEKLNKAYTYKAVPVNDYLEDIEISIVPGDSKSGEAAAVANVGKVVVPVAPASQLDDTVFVNYIKLLDSTGKVVATKIVNDTVDVVDDELTIDVSEAFAKIPQGEYKIEYNISNYEVLTTDKTYSLVGFEQADLEVEDTFKVIAKTGIKGSVLCNDKPITSTLYALLINSEDVIVAADQFDDSSYEMIDTIGNNDIDAGTYTVVIRGEGYNTYSYKKTLTNGATVTYDDIQLEEGARGKVQLYARCLNDPIAKYAATVIAYDSKYVDPSVMSINSQIAAKVSSWGINAYGAYSMYSQGNYYESLEELSFGEKYSVVVTGSNLEPTTFEASLASNDAGNTVKLADKTVNYVAGEERLNLTVSYQVQSGAGKLAAKPEYIVVYDENGNIIDNGQWMNDPTEEATSRTVTISVPTGMVGCVKVFCDGFVIGEAEITNYTVEDEKVIVLRALSNN